MQRLINKLNSNRGASIILALLFLLFAMAVGSVILTSATVNLGRTEAMTNQEQNYLAVKSAARLIEKEISSLQVVASHQSKRTFSDIGVGAGNTLVPNSENVELKDIDPTVTTVPDYATALIKPELENYYKDNNGIPSTFSPSSPTMTLKLDDPDFPVVKATFTISKDYSIKVTLLCEGDKSNILTLTLTASNVSGEEVTYTNNGHPPMEETTTYNTTITYPNATIKKGGNK